MISKEGKMTNEEELVLVQKEIDELKKHKNAAQELIESHKQEMDRYRIQVGLQEAFIIEQNERIRRAKRRKKILKQHIALASKEKDNEQRTPNTMP